jgi:hypothetical protein
MQGLFNQFSSQYYSGLIVLVMAISGLSISIIRKKEHYSLRLFPFYFIAYIILTLIFYINVISYINSPSNQNISIMVTGSDYIFTLIEFLIFMHFFYNIINSTSKKRLIALLITLFLLVYISYLANDLILYRNIKTDTVTIVYTLESAVLLIPSIFYYFQVFTNPPTINLRKESSFWVVTGIFFSMICSLPYCIIENYLRKINSSLYVQLFAILYILYCLLFLMIIRAYLCQNQHFKYELDAKHQ